MLKLSKQTLNWAVVSIIILVIIYLFIKRVRNEALCDYQPSVANDDVLGSGAPDRIPLPNPPNRNGQFYPAGIYANSGLGKVLDS